MKNNEPLSQRFYDSPKETELTQLAGSGKLPKWLAGKLVRNGPALFHLQKADLRHWFDGYGMLHGFIFQDGEIFYQSRYIKSEEYLNARRSGKVKTLAWGTASDPCRSIFRRFMATFSTAPNNTNVNVVKIGQKYFSTSDIATLTEFDIHSLQTLSNFRTTKRGVMAAHPSYTADSKLWNMISTIGLFAQNTFVTIDERLKVKRYAKYRPKKAFYFHSFGNCERYMVSIEQPMLLDFWELIKSGIKNKSFYECFNWVEDKTNVFHVYDRTQDSYQLIESSLKFFFFHTINSFQEGDILHIDLCGYTSNAIIDDFYIDRLSSEGIPEAHKASLRRVSIDMKSGKITEHDYRLNFELPHMNGSVRGKKYRYAYGVHSPKGDKRLAVKIVKYDFENQKHLMWGEDALTVGEPIFVPRPDSTTEDDGVLIILCHNDTTRRAELVILDAPTLGVTARFEVPQSIPPGLHGGFYGSA